MDSYDPIPKVYGSDSLRDGVLSPLAQAIVSGLLSGAALGAVLWVFGVESAWRWSLAVIPVVWLAVWLFSLKHWRSALERLLDRDLNDDGFIGEPPVDQQPKPEPVKITLSQDNNNRIDYISLPVRTEQLRALADGLASGRRPFSVAAWTGAGAPFSRSEFEALRDELISRGLARWKNPYSQAQGVELLASGRAVLKHFSSSQASPPPP